MADISLDTDIATIVARLDRTTPDDLLASLAKEFVLLHHGYLSLLARVNALEVTQTLHDQVAEALSAPPLVLLSRYITIDAAFSLSTEAGFYLLEYDGSGAPYRWTGPDPTFYFELMMDRSSPADMKLRYNQAYVPVADQRVRCYVDGAEIPLNEVALDVGFELQGIIPPREAVGGTVVMFVCPAVGSPAEVEFSNDRRKLGLAFRTLQIECDDSITMAVAEPEGNGEASGVSASHLPASGKPARGKRTSSSRL